MKLDQEWFDKGFLADAHPEFYTVPADDTMIGLMVNLDFDGIGNLQKKAQDRYREQV